MRNFLSKIVSYYNQKFAKMFESIGMCKEACDAYLKVKQTYSQFGVLEVFFY